LGAVFFYHLTHSPLEDTLPTLLGKARERGWRIELRGTDAARMESLDTELWQGQEEGFLAHGRAGGPHDAAQPILLTCGETAANAPQCVISVDGADLGVDEIATLDRAMIIFDGSNGAAVQCARAQWKSLTDAGCSAQYWAQDGAAWVKKAER